MCTGYALLATHLPFVKSWRVSLSGTTACNRLGDKERLEKKGDEISMATSKSPSSDSPSRSVASESDTISSGSPVLDRFSHAFLRVEAGAPLFSDDRFCGHA